MKNEDVLKRIHEEEHEIQILINQETSDGLVERTAANEQGDRDDRAEPLTSEEEGASIIVSLRLRLEALQRAQDRLHAGTYGLSTLSGKRISEERLDADLAAELTIEEMEASST